MVYLNLFLGRYFVSGFFHTLKPVKLKKPLKIKNPATKMSRKPEKYRNRRRV